MIAFALASPFISASGGQNNEPATPAAATEGTTETTTNVTTADKTNTSTEGTTNTTAGVTTPRPAPKDPAQTHPTDLPRKVVALTFDDGPSGKVTTNILNALEKHGARATFFCLGNRAKMYESQLRRMVSMGCEIASHSFEHKHLVKLSPSQLRKDLKMANDELEKYSGVRPRLLRTPYGECPKELLEKIDMPVILWSIDTLDWCYHIKPNETRTDEEIERDCQKVIDETLAGVQDGDIILMHDLYSTTERIAVELIDTLVNDGWTLVTVSELFEEKGIELENHRYYRYAR